MRLHLRFLDGAGRYRKAPRNFPPRDDERPGRNGRAVDGRSSAKQLANRDHKPSPRAGCTTGPLSFRSPRLLAIGAVDVIGADDAVNDVDDGDDDDDDDDDSACIS